MELGKRKKNTNEPYHYKESNFDSINKAFDSFYKNIIPDDEWNNFKSILKTKLPTSFRITSISKVGDHVFGILTEKYIKNISEIDNLEWYPNKMAWQLNISKRELRKDENYNEFHKYLLNETSFGSISRQETVSMIPPILMDIQSHHLVLDMCASPGSKTAQILELISSSSDIPEGFVIANDMNINRCSTLVAQLKRISCPCQFITCEDARCFPTMLKTHPDGTTKYMQFDRILCDVPCSGDGTIRKNVDMYVKWKFQMAYDLHFVQRDILQRGLELLKVGGYLLYSTCSMNPVENEAFSNNIKVSSKHLILDQIKCIDVSSKLKDLKYLPGVVDWNFINSQNLMCKRGLIEIPTPHEYVEYELKNWFAVFNVRIHPHLQNTGGFFIALLYKESEIVNRNENAIETNPKKVNPNNKLKYKSSLKNYSRPLLDTDSDWSEITAFFELRNVKPSNLIIRSENDAKNTIYYINDQMVDFLSQNKSRIKVTISEVFVDYFVRKSNFWSFFL
ncbi:hypothetical protein HZS_7518 [Henneguya salminicola]|nr:hypothetical protein HZS_7518 [Henneguya salminicola]